MSIVLFDVDGTLTEPRKKIHPDMIEFLKELHKYVDIGVVGGSDLGKIKEQLGNELLSYDFIDYVFSENGLLAYHKGICIGQISISDFLGQARLQEVINFCLHYIADLQIPIKTGTFIEYRMGMLNVSPIGRNCSYEQRVEFEAYDKVHKIREKFIQEMSKKFPELAFSVGGMISFDVFPHGWDKTYCLKYLNYKEIYFFGDKTHKGGNDHEIFIHPDVKGNQVTSPQNTMYVCKNMFTS